MPSASSTPSRRTPAKFARVLEKYSPGGSGDAAAATSGQPTPTKSASSTPHKTLNSQLGSPATTHSASASATSRRARSRLSASSTNASEAVQPTDSAPNVWDLLLEKFSSAAWLHVNTAPQQASTTAHAPLLTHNTLLVHRDILQRLNLHVNQRVLICNVPKHDATTSHWLVCRVYSHQKVSVGGCRLYINGGSLMSELPIGSTIRVYSQYAQPTTAKSITFNIRPINTINEATATSQSPTPPTTLQQITQQYLQHSLVDEYIVMKQAYRIKLMDSEFEFELQDLKSDVDVDLQPRASPASNLLESFDKLLIDQPSDQNSNSPTQDPILYHITKQTAISFTSAAPSAPAQPQRAPTFEQIGGLTTELQAIREVIELPVTSPHLYQQFGISRPARGVLIHGKGGTGKSMIGRALKSSASLGGRITHYYLAASELLTDTVNEAETRLVQLFNTARQHAPAVIFIDDIDIIAPRRTSDAVDTQQRRLVSCLLTQMDGLTSHKSVQQHVVVVGATSRPDSIDSAIRRSGRFDSEIELSIPNRHQRHAILQCILADVKHSLTAEQVVAIADVTHGFVGADLQLLVSEAAIQKLQSMLNIDDVQLTTDALDSIRLTNDDIRSALNLVKPSAMREVLIEVPKVQWSDIGGHHSIKQKLHEAIELPLQKPHLFTQLGITPPRGILLYGPPGNSKTMMARALATECRRNFLAVKGPELFSKYVGDSERAVRELFRKARAAAPSILFFDEIDSLAGNRGEAHSHAAAGGGGGSRVGDRVLSQLLVELDGVEPLSEVTILAATNRPDMIDRALLRPGRFDRLLYVAMPDLNSRQTIVQLQLKQMAHAGDINVQSIAERTDGYSGAEMVALCRSSAMAAMEEDVNIAAVGMRHFDAAIQQYKPRTSPQSIEWYENYGNKNRSTLF